MNHTQLVMIIKPKHNGNIAEIDWMSKDESLKRYGYQYDNLNRLLKGNYQDPASTLPASHTNDETLTYDLNGNIKTLVRNAQGFKTNVSVIDNLGYQYTGNRVTNITDASSNSSGYEGGGQTMTYDSNGNMTKMPDKGISAIAYNFLNLPKQINQNTNVTNYFYRADGAKVKKTFTLTNSAGSKVINTEYLDGFQYSTPNTEPIRKALEKEDDATMKVTTAGEEEAFSKDPDRKIVVVDPGTPQNETMTLSFFPTAEGFYDFENLRYIYQYKDHLGNVRVSYTKNGNDLEIRDRNDYYPFGMSFLKPSGTTSMYDPMAIPYNYKFLGEELQETGFYDLNARFYMPDAVIFGQHDPLSEKTLQPYAYGYNNPIRYGDPTGLSGNDFVQRKDGSIHWDNNANSQSTTKAGETYLGKNLSFTFNSFIGDNYDGAMGSLPEGDKLTTTINLSASENSAGELTGLSATKTTEIGKTFGISFLKGRDYYPGEGGSNNSFTKSGMSINYEQHASVPSFEESGLNAMGFKVVDVSQKLNISFDKKSGNLSVNAYTNIFPSATLKLNNTGTTLMNYKQPSFVGTHTAPTINNAVMGRGGVELPAKDFSYYPSRFYKRN